MNEISVRIKNCIAFTACVAFWVILASLARAQSPEDAYPLPFRSVDLAQGHFATGGNHGASADDEGSDSHARDWKIHRLKENGEWTDKYANITDNPYCANGERDCDVYGRSIIYRLPLYAPADGEIVSCWRNHPNNLEKNKPLRCCNGDCTMLNEKGKSLACDDDSGSKKCPPEFGCPVTRSGNYIALLTAEGHRILLAHLAPGTIPKELCPFDKELMNNANIHPCSDSDCSPFPTEAIIPEGKRPKVRRGDFLGRAGSSGAASGPHTHIHQGPMKLNAAGILVKDGPNHPYLIENAWMRPSEKPSWTKLTGSWEMKKTEANPEPRVKPSPFLRTGTETATGAQTVSLAGSVASIVDSGGTLRLVAWDIGGNGSIQKQQSATGVKVDLIASAQSGRDRDVVTAARNESGNFRIDYWRVSDNGAISHKDSETTGPIDDVAITPYPTGTGVIVAVKAGNGNLKLIGYETDNAGNLERSGSAEGEAVRAVSIAGIRKGRRSNEDPAKVFLGVATAVKTQGGKLRIQTWRWNAKNGTLSAAHSHTGGDILGQVAISTVPLPDDRQMLVTAARTESGMLLQSWSVNSQGEFENRWTNRLGDAHDITINAISDGRFVTSLKNGQGYLMVIGWSLGQKGKIGRLGDESAGTASGISSAMLRRNNGKTRLILTGMRDGGNNLRMIVYDSNL